MAIIGNMGHLQVDIGQGKIYILYLHSIRKVTEEIEGCSALFLRTLPLGGLVAPLGVIKL